MLIVCPAGLTLQWRDEMRDKFGLDFRIVDAALLRELRRSRGLYANPWTHYPRLIVSIDWLKRDRPMRLLREVLPIAPKYPRTFDMLVVDEVHTCAPSGRGKYAVDSHAHPGDPDPCARTASTACSSPRPRTTDTWSRSPPCWNSSTTSGSPGESGRATSSSPGSWCGG